MVHNYHFLKGFSAGREDLRVTRFGVFLRQYEQGYHAQLGISPKGRMRFGSPQPGKLRDYLVCAGRMVFRCGMRVLGSSVWAMASRMQDRTLVRATLGYRILQGDANASKDGTEVSCGVPICAYRSPIRFKNDIIRVSGVSGRGMPATESKVRRTHAILFHNHVRAAKTHEVTCALSAVVAQVA